MMPFPGATTLGVAFVNGDWNVVVGANSGKALALTLDTDELIFITGERLAQGPSRDEYQFYAIDSCRTPEGLYSGSAYRLPDMGGCGQGESCGFLVISRQLCLLWG